MFVTALLLTVFADQCIGVLARSCNEARCYPTTGPGPSPKAEGVHRPQAGQQRVPRFTGHGEVRERHPQHPVHVETRVPGPGAPLNSRAA